jgi:hypothetical protein
MTQNSTGIASPTGLASGLGGQGLREVIAIIAVAVIVIGGGELLLRFFEVPQYILPTPSAIAAVFGSSEMSTIGAHYAYTLIELFSGYAIGASIGLVLAAVITQFPFVEKVITPYILLLVTTPMLALVPLLILNFGFGYTPRIIAVALASGPMVMINAATGFRRAVVWCIDAANLHQNPYPHGDADGDCWPDDRGHLRDDHCGRCRHVGWRVWAWQSFDDVFVDPSDARILCLHPDPGRHRNHDLRLLLLAGQETGRLGKLTSKRAEQPHPSEQ